MRILHMPIVQQFNPLSCNQLQFDSLILGLLRFECITTYLFTSLIHARTDPPSCSITIYIVPGHKINGISEMFRLAVVKFFDSLLEQGRS